MKGTKKKKESKNKKKIQVFCSFLEKENHLWLSSRMNEPSAYIVTPRALATCFALLHCCQAHLHRIEMDVQRAAKLKWSICRVTAATRTWHLPQLLRGMRSGPLPHHSYTSQFHSWKQCFMIIHFRCAVSPPF